MKPTRILQQLICFALLVFIFSCDVTKEIEDFEVEVDALDIEQLNIPDGFDFSTQKQVNVTITDSKDNIKYDVYAYSDKKQFVGIETYENEEGVTVTDSVFKSDVLENLIFSGATYNGRLNQTITLPTYYDKLYIRRKEGYKYSASIQDVVGNEVNFNGESLTSKRSLAKKPAGVTDYLYCVNGSAELFQVDPLNGDLVYLSDMPMGSYTCAIDQENRVLYSIGRSNPFPLMKYSIDNNTWEIVGNVEKGGPRLEYNDTDGLLYFSSGRTLYTYDPANGNTLNTWQIDEGLNNTGGGDLSIAEDGTMYLASFGGLYRIVLNNSSNIYEATRLSADNLPFNPTSMTIDSNQELWLASNGSSSDLIVMDTETGGWEYRFGINANNNTDFGRTINDLTTFRVFSEVIDQTDTDNDGIIDSEDEYPEDAEKAFEVFTPSKYGWGTLAFEDLWPSTGDYDFNDVALKYKCIAILNSQNLAVQVDFIYTVKANGAGFNNGFGIELENVSPSLVESVSGTALQEGYVNVSANGTESGQDNAVVILFDNARAMLGTETTVSIEFTQPIDTGTLGVAPFNPFLIINGNREKEVHLPFRSPTTLGDNIAEEVTGPANKDTNGDYVTNTGLPWAINVVHDFKVPKEKVSVKNAYNFFAQWATSGGGVYTDWYKDNSGYRNVDKIQN
ncbi:LruC domain-containing protein [Seonamhaeicola marinus]|nr:LruC domain-containing protein [Seonamhaeicola marinus]